MKVSRAIWRTGLAAAVLGCVPALLGCHHRQENSDTGTLVSTVSMEPTTFDPAQVTDLRTSEVLQNCFECLTQMDGQNRLQPCLAQSWDLSKDGRMYTFHLRHGVTFHNGNPFRAEDVKYSWERAVAPHTASSVASNYLDGILGLKDVIAGHRTDLPGIKVLNPYTVQVAIDRPRSYFLAMLTTPVDAIVCRAAVQRTAGIVTKDSCIGTGPYVLDSYLPGRSISFRAYDSYWGGKPVCRRIEMPIILDPTTTYSNFITKAVDVWPDLVPMARYVQDRDAGKDVSAYRLLAVAAVDYLVMQRVKQPAFASRDVRRAFAMAIDRADLDRIAYKGIGTPADGMLPSNMPGSGEPPPHIPYDPAAARALLSRAGYPGGAGFPSLTLTFSQNVPERAAAAALIQEQLKTNLGIQISLRQMEAGEFFKDETDGDMELYIIGWTADYLDPQDFLSTLFQSHAPLNHSMFQNARFDALCNEADAEPDLARRAPLYSQANRILMEDAGVLPLIFPPRIAMVQPNVRGWGANLCNVLPLNHVSK